MIRTQLAKLSLFHRILFWTNGVFALALCASYLAPYISPSSFWPLAFAGLGYPVLTAINFLFVLYWILAKKKLFWVPLGVLLLGFPYHKDFFRIDLSDGPKENASQPIEVMSFNVRLFGLYEWDSNTRTRDRILRFLRTEQPDVLCFQEYFYSKETNYFKTKSLLKDRLEADKTHQAFAHRAAKKHFFGIATYSNFPIIDKGRVEFPQGQKNICIYSDLNLGKDTVRVYNAHLGSIRTRGDRLNSLKGWSSILGKLKDAFIRRADQVDRIVEHMRKTPHPIIMCGDLNDTPISYAYQRFDSFLQDSFTQSGNGMGRTYIGDMPSFRIDYIFHSEEIHSFHHDVIQEKLSDHRPIKCKIQFKKEE